MTKDVNQLAKELETVLQLRTYLKAELKKIEPEDSFAKHIWQKLHEQMSDDIKLESESDLHYLQSKFHLKVMDGHVKLLKSEILEADTKIDSIKTLLSNPTPEKQV